MGEFCKYKDIFGIPDKGIHSYRFLDVALIDYILTIVMAAVLSKLTGMPFVISTILMFALGIILHAIFCVPTSAVRYLGFI